MKTSCREFIDSLIQHSPGMQVVYREVADYWSPEDPPVTTLLAELGDRIVEDFETAPDGVNNDIFRLIETAMLSGDDQLVTVVATGLIEGIVARMSEEEQMQQRILSTFGEQSRRHAEAWLSG